MVLPNLSKNCSNNMKSKPPLVVFTVCMLGIIVTTLCLAYYVHNNDNILNVDAKDNWLSVINHLSTRTVCIETTNGPVFRNAKKDSDKMKSVASFVKVPKELRHSQDTNVQGLISLQDWSGKCPDAPEPPANLQIAFVLPRIDHSANNTDENICVTLTGPAAFMPKLLEYPSCGPPIKQGARKKWRKLTTLPNHTDRAGFCTRGMVTKLEFDDDYSRNLKYDMYLSHEDRITINSHLIITSSFLMFIVVLIACYALLRFKNNNNNLTDSKQLLMSKGMYL